MRKIADRLAGTGSKNLVGRQPCSSCWDHRPSCFPPMLFITLPSLEFCLWISPAKPLISPSRSQSKRGGCFIDWLVRAIPSTSPCCSAVTWNYQFSTLKLGRCHLEFIYVLLCFWLDITNKKLAECQRSCHLSQVFLFLP